MCFHHYKLYCPLYIWTTLNILLVFNPRFRRNQYKVFLYIYFWYSYIFGLKLIVSPPPQYLCLYIQLIGRFDRRVTIDLPDSAARKKIIDLYLSKIPHDGAFKLLNAFTIDLYNPY